MGPKSLNNLIIGTNFLSNRASFIRVGFKTDHNCQLNVSSVNETKVEGDSDIEPIISLIVTDIDTVECSLTMKLK